ncbi:YkyA family protein [Pullulanibacillus pueri]|uniref:Lipoprotein n=1 Tax=Pullulanibacillus pueri TaxID=1437324 RepID=A0A8J2ZSF0_9BACL|nr:YkyA family protein [Pullulanibacillus pueri]GGH74241.1 hypothetical protein GCM10007096_02260 [Pullulanibacillus pueri]
MAKHSKPFLACVLALIVITLLSGCNKKSEGDQAFDFMEKAAAEEQTFNEQQQPLVDEEKKEQDLYNKIMNVDVKDDKQVSKYSDQALASIEKRQKMMEKEKKSIDSAYKLFQKAVPHINKVKEEKAQKPGKQTIENMEKRYEAFGDLYKVYTASITDDQKLFKLMTNKKLTTEDLQKQLKVVNDHYESIEKNKETFNKYTESFNKEKQSFYSALGIKSKNK